MVQIWSAQLVSALQYTHSQDYIHRDVKLENILLDKRKHAYLADFGLCVHLSAAKVGLTKCGTAEYLAPEMLLTRCPIPRPSHAMHTHTHTHTHTRTHARTHAHTHTHTHTHTYTHTHARARLGMVR